MLPAAAYHAGLDAETRERVQTAFQAGELEVVVATIAFGMGIDKANIRTVIHAGLPATLEGYYQEIGRAGRDGALSRTYLMHSYADQRTHDFFLNRDYPPARTLAPGFSALGEEPQPVEELRAASELDEEEFDKALEKLEIHGGARVDFGGNVTGGAPGWKKTYTIQAQYRAEQFEKVVRIHRLERVPDVRAGAPFWRCEGCQPAVRNLRCVRSGGAVLRLFRHATPAEREYRPSDCGRTAAGGLQGDGNAATKLDLVGRISRDEFDALLDAMVRAGLIEIEEAEFEKDGEVMRFRKVRLTDAGFDVRRAAASSDRRRHCRGVRCRQRPAAADEAIEIQCAKAGQPIANPPQLTPASERLAAQLREWRTAEAKRLGVPAM